MSSPLDMDDLEDIVLDEIALEGLNGVSLERLWVLLEQRKAPFPLKLDDHTKNFIWEDLLSHHQTVSFYTVPKEFQQLNEGVVEEQTPAKKAGKHKAKTDEALIDHLITKERGYCPCYKQRKNVTTVIRRGTKTACLSLQEVTKKYGNSLVVVASQEARLRALISHVTSPDVPLLTMQYCCLEEVGRCRYLGTSQSTIANKFDIDNSTVFHMCKVLLGLRLVIKETENLPHIYLIRFKPRSRIAQKQKIEDKILDLLASQPNKMLPRYELVEHVLKSEEEDVTYNQFKKTLGGLKSNKFVVAENIAAKDLPQFSCPEVTQSMEALLRKIKEEEGESANKGRKPEDFVINCIRLLHTGDGVEDDDDDDDADLDLKGIHALREIDFSRLSMTSEQTDTQQVYYYVEKNQNEMNGVSIIEAVHALMMDRYRVRGIFKRLVRQQLVRSFAFTTGRGREMRFFTQRGLDEKIVSERVLQMYHQGKKKPSRQHSSSKVDDTPDITSLSEACGSSDHLESSPGVSQPTEKSEKTTQDTEPAHRFKLTQSWKNLERSQLVLEHVANVHVTELRVLHKHVVKSEAEMGSKAQCCRKSLLRMVQNMAKEGKLNFFTKEIQRKGHSKKETAKIVMDASIEENGPQVQALLDEITIKPNYPPKTQQMPVLYQKLQTKPGGKSLGISHILQSKMQHNSETRKTMEKYGYSGKMERLEAIHKFLWYLLYEEEKGEVKLEPLETISPGNKESRKTSTMAPEWEAHETQQANVVAQSIRSDTTVTEEGQGLKNQSLECEEQPRTHVECYLDTTDPSDWRRYVPPGKGHVGRVKGWATLDYILSTLPLSLFVKIYSVTNTVPGLEETLQHPRMRHYPISIIYHHLFHGYEIKRAVSKLHSCLVALSGMGLLYFDRIQKFHNRNQVNFYVCRSGSFLDTTSSAPGYDQVEDKEYPKRSYQFTSLEDVTQFWIDFKMTCFGTPLGVFKAQSSKAAKESKIEVMVAVSVHEAPPDPVTIPGDHRGAAGLDTSYYAHRSVNWGKIRCKDKKTERKTPKVEFVVKSETEDKGGDKDRVSEKVEVKKITVSAKEHKKATAGGKGQKRKTLKIKPKFKKDTAKKKSAPASRPTVPGAVENAAGDKSKVETANRKGKKVKKQAKSKTHQVRNLHIYDDEDLQASQRKILRRVRWSAREDNFLLLCGLSLRILRVKCAKSDTVKRFVGWAVVRDLLRENLEESFDKTAAAAARRFRNLLKDQTNMSNFTVCLTDIRADKEIMTDFMTRKRDYEDEAVRQQEFKELCYALAKKFECRDKSEMIVLPSTLEALYEKYDFMTSNIPVATTMEEFEVRDVKSEEEIIASILSKIVLISMLSHHYKQHHMKEIYFALRRYDPVMLCKAVDLFKSNGFMGRNRNSILEAINTNRAMHVVPMSFQFTKTFFKLFDAPTIPSKTLDDTSTMLSEIMAACKQGSGETSSEGDEVATVCIDNMKGNKSSIFCIPALELASDSVEIPKDIISLELSASDRVRLQKKHDEEMMREVEDGDLDGDDEVDSLSEKPREAKRKASEISEDGAHRKLRRQLVHGVGRRKIEFVRNAHKEWCQTLADKQGSKPKTTKGAMTSLIPRLLYNEDGQKVGGDSDSSRTNEPSRESNVNDPTANARRSLALDHDYCIQKEDQTPETSHDGDQSEVFCQPMSEETAATSEDTVPVDKASSPCKASLDDQVSKTKSSDSFFAWLTMRGFLTQEYSKKPQNIQEDMTVRRISVHLKPKVCLLQTLDRYLVSHQQDPLQHTQIPKNNGIQRTCSSQPSSFESEGQCRDNTGEHGFQSEGKLIPHDRTSSFSKHSESKSRTMRTIPRGHVQSLGELVCQPCGPVQAFRSISSDLRPNLEYTVGKPCRILKDVCKGHEDSELMRTIFQLVKAKGSLGLTYPHLLDSLGLHRQNTRTKVFNCLRVLLEEQLILEVGTTVVRLVAQVCASPWLLKSVRSIVVPTTTPSESSGLDSPPKKTKVLEQSISQAGETNGDFTVRDELKTKRGGGGLQEETPESSGLDSPAKKTKVLEQSISQAGVTNGDFTVRDERKTRREGEGLPDEETLPPHQVDSSSRLNNNDRLQEESLIMENALVESDKNATETNGSADVMATDENVSGLASQLRGKKRKKPEKEEQVNHDVQYEPVTIQCHPWTNIDGSVNTKSLSLFVSSIGLTIISKPGIKESDIFNHFQNVMAPVECLHLIKILVNADIITRHSTYCSIKLNLFGPPLNTKPKSVVFYQPTVGALMNLALLKDNLLQSKVGVN